MSDGLLRAGQIVAIVSIVAALTTLVTVWLRRGGHVQGTPGRGRHATYGRPSHSPSPLLAIIAASLVLLVVFGMGGRIVGRSHHSAAGDVTSSTGSGPPAALDEAGGPQPTGPGSVPDEAATSRSDAVADAFGPLVAVRGLYGRDGSPSGLDSVLDAGFDTVTVAPNREDLDDLADRGLRGLVWLGDYGRGQAPCSFELTDAEVSGLLSEIGGHPAIAAYYIADEPSIARASGCPEAVDAVRARSALVESLDPSHPTFVTLATWDGKESFPFEYWRGAADIFGLVVYPCFQGRCDFELIEAAIDEADADRLAEYWAIVQDFSDAWYDLPDAAALETQFRMWASSRMTGYMLFAGHGFPCCQGSDFEVDAAKLQVLRAWNG